MKLLVTQDETGAVVVKLGDQVLPGVTHVAFSAGVDDPAGRILLEISDVAVHVQIDDQLIEIASTPISHIPGLEVEDEEQLWIGALAPADLERLR